MGSWLGSRLGVHQYVRRVARGARHSSWNRSRGTATRRIQTGTTCAHCTRTGAAVLCAAAAGAESCVGGSWTRAHLHLDVDIDII